MNVQEAKELEITEGNVRTIHASDGKLLWGRLAYNTNYGGNTTQQTYSGKNLFNINASPNLVNTTTTIEGQSITVTSNENTSTARADYPITYVANTTLTIGYDYEVLVNNTTLTTAHVYMCAGSDIILDTSFNLTVGNKGHKTITLSGGTADTTKRLWLYIKNSAVAGELSIKFSNIQLEYADSETSYEPYVGGVPAPNPSYPQNIKIATGTQTVTLSDGVISEDYTLSLGSTELCKIGDYQDYIYKSGDDWYVHKETGKVLLDGSEASLAYLNGVIYYDGLDVIVSDTCYSNYYLYGGVAGNTTAAYANGNNRISFFSTGNRIFIRNDALSSKANWQTWLSSHNTSVYYVIATPTDTQITDTTLISQLEAVQEFLTRYGYQSTVTGDIPLIINQTALV